MTTTLFDTQPAVAGDGTGTLGVIGTRQMVAVQTFDIARLTSHPVAIIPSSFIAVTSRGPRDSNESGKTSFNAAVALLLGDPEWRVTGGGVAAVAELLFEPDTAGVARPRGVLAGMRHASQQLCDGRLLQEGTEGGPDAWPVRIIADLARGRRLFRLDLGRLWILRACSSNVRGDDPEHRR